MARFITGRGIGGLMKLGLTVLVFGIAIFPTCSADVGPNDLWKFNSPMNFTLGSEVDMGIVLTRGVDTGFAINPEFAEKIGVPVSKSLSGIEPPDNLIVHPDDVPNGGGGTEPVEPITTEPFKPKPINPFEDEVQITSEEQLKQLLDTNNTSTSG